jgi:hypothetical protein
MCIWLHEETAMKHKTGSNRVLHSAGAMATISAVAFLATGCGIVHVHFGSASTGSVTIQPTAAFVRCMRSHGLTKFPATSGSYTVQLKGDSHVVQAYDACKHLLGTGSGG